jgi:hypothetical protein
MSWSILFLMSVLTVALSAKKPDRTWLTGTVLEVTMVRQSAVTGATTTGTVDSNGGVNTTTTTNRRSWDEGTYQIDAGDRLYVISESIPRFGGSLISIRMRKSVGLVAGSEITYTVDRDAIIIQADGKERKLHILQVRMKPKTQ